MTAPNAPGYSCPPRPATASPAAPGIDAALHDILNNSATAEGEKITSEQPITKDGVRGIEVRAKVSDGYDARFMVLVSGSHVYLLGAHAKHGTQQLFDALVASLVMH